MLKKKSPARRSHHLQKTSPRWKSYLFLLVTVVLWGAALPIVKPALSFTTPFRYLLYRFVLAAIVSIPILIYYIPKIKNLRRTTLMITALELIGTTLSLSVLYFGLARTTSLAASLLATTTPLFTVLGGVWYLKEKEEGHEWLGLLLAFTGTIAITLAPFIRSDAEMLFSMTGNILILLQNIISSAYFVLAKKYYTTVPKFFATSVSFFIGAISFLLLSLWEVGGSFTVLINQVSVDLLHPAVVLAAVYMAIGGSVIALTCYIQGQSGIEASEASLFFYLQPLVYVPLSFFMLNERIGMIEMIALVAILVGVAIAEKRTKKALR